MVVGWIESNCSTSGIDTPLNKLKLFSPEEGNKDFVYLDLSGCAVTDLIQHCLFRVIGRFYHKSNGWEIKVQSLHSVPTWNYHTFSQFIQERRTFMTDRSDHI